MSNIKFLTSIDSIIIIIVYSHRLLSCNIRKKIDNWSRIHYIAPQLATTWRFSLRFTRFFFKKMFSQCWVLKYCAVVCFFFVIWIKDTYSVVSIWSNVKNEVSKEINFILITRQFIEFLRTSHVCVRNAHVCMYVCMDWSTLNIYTVCYVCVHFKRKHRIEFFLMGKMQLKRCKKKKEVNNQFQCYFFEVNFKFI